MRSYEETIEMVDKQAIQCKAHWTSEITWLERCKPPCYGQYDYHDYDHIGFCNIHKHIVYYGGGRRSSFDTCVGPPNSHWYYKSGKKDFSLKEVEAALKEVK